jgi:L-cysteine/cystine lyase
VITTTLEHPGGLIPLYVLQKRWGVQVKLVELEASDSPETIVARFAAEITPRTRLLAFSHVAWNLGIQLPLAALTTLAHQHQAWVAVDGAQSTGAIPLDLPASQVDFYAMPGQKWLCGPEGTGALYVRPELLEQLEQTFVGYASLDNGQYDLAGNFVPGADARRFEVGTLYTPGLRAMAANLHWLADSVGWDWIHARIVHLADYARTALSGIAGVDVITPVGTQSGLTSFTLTEQQPEQVVATLAERGIMLRTIQRPHALRLSTGFFNLEAEIDYLVETLQSILTD